MAAEAGDAAVQGGAAEAVLGMAEALGDEAAVAVDSVEDTMTEVEEEEITVAIGDLLAVIRATASVIDEVVMATAPVDTVVGLTGMAQVTAITDTAPIDLSTAITVRSRRFRTTWVTA